MTVINSRMMRQAIRTKHFGPGIARGAKVKATASAGSLAVDWDHDLNHAQNHAAAAQAFADKYKWPGELAGGVLSDGTYAFVFVTRDGHPV